MESIVAKGFSTAFAVATAFALTLPVGLQAGPVEDLYTWLATPRASRPDIAGQSFANASLSAADCAKARDLIWIDRTAQVKAEGAAEWGAKILSNKDNLKMPFDYRIYGTKPAKGYDLYISMHGGGETDKATNDEQWQNQITLYQPNGIYLAPRAPTDAWNMWHKDHIDGFFDRIIQLCVANLGANPDRVYVMGYSAGGDGTYQMAPRMADRWAAAAMMAGYPNNASPINLRNIGFTMHVGALDAAYNRNTICVAYGKEIQKLQDADVPGFYKYDVQVHPGKPHWMDLEDKVALDWTYNFTRNPYPAKVVWKQDTTVGTNSFPGSGAPVAVKGHPTQFQFYWIALPEKKQLPFQAQVTATIKGQDVNISDANVDSLLVLLNDTLLDLDKPVRVLWNGKTVYQAIPPRTIANLWRTVQDRGDRAYAFPSQLKVDKTAQVSLAAAPERTGFEIRNKNHILSVAFGSPLTGSIRVSDVTGACILAHGIRDQAETEIPTGNFKSGVYFISMRTGVREDRARIFLP